MRWRRGSLLPSASTLSRSGEAQVEIVADDAAEDRRLLAETCIDVLAEIRSRLDDFAPFFLRASPELRAALHRGPDGLDEQERKRRERLNAASPSWQSPTSPIPLTPTS